MMYYTIRGIKMETTTIIKDWADKTGLGTKVLETDLSRLGEQVKKVHPKWDEAKIDREALSILRLELGTRYGRLSSPAPMTSGFIIGIDGLKDWVAIMFAKSERMYRENPAHAIEQEYTDEQGNPVQRTDQKYGKRKKGDLLEGHDYERYVYAIGDWGEGDHVVSIKYTGGLAENLSLDPNVILGVPVKWRANVTQKGEVTRQTASAAAGTSYAQFGKPMDYDDIVAAVEGSLGLVELLDIENELNRRPQDERYTMLLAFEARVVRCSPSRFNPDQFTLRVTDDSSEFDLDLDDKGLTVYMAPGMEDVPINTRVLLVGRPRSSTYQDEVNVVFDAFGVLPDRESGIGLEADGEEFVSTFIPLDQ